jgi:hypothetical protein
VSGCSSRKIDLPTATVTGVVTYKGKPLEVGRITFMHSKSGHAAATDLNADGSFKVTAFQGENLVAIQSLVDKPGDSTNGAGLHALTGPGMRPLQSRIPIRYMEFVSSGFKCNVKAQDNRADFVLKD